MMHQARPLPKGMAALEGSLGGGVFTNRDAPISVPVSTLGVRYGMTNRLSADGHVHGTEAAFEVAGLDLGLSGVLMDSADPVYPLPILGGRVNVLAGNGGFRLYPEGSMVFTHLFDDGWAYYGADFLFDPFPRASNPSSTVIASVLGGGGVALGDDKRWSLAAELRWLAVDAPSLPSTVAWASVDGHGAVGLMLGVQRWFEVDVE